MDDPEKFLRLAATCGPLRCDVHIIWRGVAMLLRRFFNLPRSRACGPPYAYFRVPVVQLPNRLVEEESTFRIESGEGGLEYVVYWMLYEDVLSIRGFRSQEREATNRGGGGRRGNGD